MYWLGITVALIWKIWFPSVRKHRFWKKHAYNWIPYQWYCFLLIPVNWQIYCWKCHNMNVQVVIIISHRINLQLSIWRESTLCNILVCVDQTWKLLSQVNAFCWVFLAIWERKSPFISSTSKKKKKCKIQWCVCLLYQVGIL